MEIPSAAIRRAYGVRRTLALSKFTSGILRGTCQRSPIFALLWGDATPRSFLPGGHRHRARLLRSEEHTSELQSHLNLVCRLLLEKKKKKKKKIRAKQKQQKNTKEHI